MRPDNNSYSYTEWTAGVIILAILIIGLFYFTSIVSSTNVATGMKPPTPTSNFVPNSSPNHTK